MTTQELETEYSKLSAVYQTAFANAHNRLGRGVMEADAIATKEAAKALQKLLDIRLATQQPSESLSAATRQELADRITQYLCVGGFFNPEAMEHDKVRTLLMDCRDALAAAPAGEQIEGLRGLVKDWRERAKETHESSVWQRKEGHMSDEEYGRAGVHTFQLNECADELEALLAAGGKG